MTIKRIRVQKIMGITHHLHVDHRECMFSFNLFICKSMEIFFNFARGLLNFSMENNLFMLGIDGYEL